MAQAGARTVNAGPDLRHGLCLPLDQVVPGVPRHHPVGQRDRVVPAAVTAQPLGVPMPDPAVHLDRDPQPRKREWALVHHASLTDGHTVKVTSGSIKPPRRIQTHTI
jgi:hypothetical protein